MTDKETARKLGKAARKNREGDVADNAKMHLLMAVEFDEISSVHIYDAIHSELSTKPVVDWISAYYPDIQVHIQSHEPDFPKSAFDLIVIPALLVDTDGHRVGYGGGGYDRFLEHQTGKKVAYVYDEQISVESIEQEDSDQAVDVIVSDKRIISC